MEHLENRTFDEIAIGDSARSSARFATRLLAQQIRRSSEHLTLLKSQAAAAREKRCVPSWGEASQSLRASGPRSSFPGSAPVCLPLRSSV